VRYYERGGGQRQGAITLHSSFLFVDTVHLVCILCIQYFCNLINVFNFIFTKKTVTIFEVINFKESFGASGESGKVLLNTKV
jgi:hypothetical protein